MSDAVGVVLGQIPVGFDVRENVYLGERRADLDAISSAAQARRS